ncbi:SUMF1/EgtB/PvdO family nonheme iron enzyme [Thermodesulfobacteriota bacterium]
MEELIRKCLPTYEISDKLGKGVHGNVFSITDTLKDRAVKIVPLLVERSRLYSSPGEMDSRISQDFHAVREYYENIKGEGVVEIYDFHLVERESSQQQAQAFLVIVMELCQDNLQDHVVTHYPLSADTVQNLMTSLAKTLRRLYQEAKDTFLVTDLKPSNLLLRKDGSLLLGDLGGLKRLSSISTISTAQFSPSWSAPELVLLGNSPGISGAIYSYGLVSYFMWEGHLPYEDKTFIERIELLKKDGIRFSRKDVPGFIREIINRCTEFRVDNRPGQFDEILNMLRRSPAHLDTASSVGAKTVVEPGEFSGDMSDTIAMDTSPQEPKKKIEKPGRIIKEPVSGIKFVWIPDGDFLMGRPPEDAEAYPNEKPERQIHVDGFWIGMYPVTQGQWKAVMGSNPSYFPKGANYPVEQVSWKASLEFAMRLSGLCADRHEFALPTEAQWEYAARSGGKKEKYAGGDDAGALSWNMNNSGFSTHPVGGKEANGLGIYDMSGNVMEWCGDPYFDPTGDESVSSGSDQMKRVCRGGSWNHDERHCRTTARRGVPMGFKYSYLGLRVVINP